MHVAKELNESLIAIDFLTDFQCILDLGSQKKITLNRTPRERLRRYPSPCLDLQLILGNGDAFHMTTMVDTGSASNIAL